MGSDEKRRCDQSSDPDGHVCDIYTSTPMDTSITHTRFSLRSTHYDTVGRDHRASRRAQGRRRCARAADQPARDEAVPPRGGGHDGRDQGVGQLRAVLQGEPGGQGGGLQRGPLPRLQVRRGRRGGAFVLAWHRSTNHIAVTGVLPRLPSSMRPSRRYDVGNDMAHEDWVAQPLPEKPPYGLQARRGRRGGGGARVRTSTLLTTG